MAGVMIVTNSPHVVPPPTGVTAVTVAAIDRRLATVSR